MKPRGCNDDMVSWSSGDVRVLHTKQVPLTLKFDRVAYGQRASWKQVVEAKVASGPVLSALSEACKHKHEWEVCCGTAQVAFISNDWQARVATKRQEARKSTAPAGCNKLADMTKLKKTNEGRRKPEATRQAALVSVYLAHRYRRSGLYQDSRHGCGVSEKTRCCALRLYVDSVFWVATF